MPQPPPQKDRGVRGWGRLAGIGTEFAATVGGFCVLGWWIDRHWQMERHWALLICALIGLVGGLYNMVRQALAAVKPDKQEHEHGPAARDR